MSLLCVLLLRLTSFLARFSSAVISGSFGTAASGASSALPADFLVLGFVDLVVESLEDFGVDVPFGAFGVVFNLMLVRGFLTESRCGISANWIGCLKRL
jgi:hypothetical protein